MSAQSFDNPSSLAAVDHDSASRSDAVIDFSPRKSGHAFDITGAAAPHKSVTTGKSDGDLHPIACPETLGLPAGKCAPLITASTAQATGAIEAYQGLRTRLLKLQSAQDFRSVAITSLSRAEGKTVTAFNLAYCFAQIENISVLLVDADLRSQGLSNLLLDLPAIGLHDVIMENRPWASAITKTPGLNLYAIGAGTRKPSAIDLFSKSRWAEFMRWATNQFSLVLVDAVAMGIPADFDLILSQCDRMLLVVRSEMTDRESIRRAMQHLDRNKLAGIVFNGSNGARPEY